MTRTAPLSVTGILLAAGTGSRFGGNKLLHPLPDGTPLGVRAARNLLAGVDRGVAILRANDRLANLLRAEGFQTIICPTARDGMGKSLACGIASAPDTSAWLVALADMPFIQRGTIRGVANLLRAGAPLAAPSCRLQHGHPVGFAREFFHELIQLDGDHGARHLIDRHAARLQLFECLDPGIFRDIDTADDLRATQV